MRDHRPSAFGNWLYPGKNKLIDFKNYSPFLNGSHWKRLWCWEGLGAGGEGEDRGWGGWMASLTRWTWVWVNSGSWWWTGRPGMLRFMGSQRVGHDWETELNWQSQAITPGSAAHREQTIGVLGCHYCTLKWYHMVFISFWLSSLTVMISRSMLLPMAQFCSFLWLSHIRPYLCTNSSVSISLLMNI